MPPKGGNVVYGVLRHDQLTWYAGIAQLLILPYVASDAVDLGICQFAVDHGIDLTRGRGDAMINPSPPTEGGTAKGLIKMTAYTTRTLAEAVIGDDGKASTRTLRKFLRDDTTAKGGTIGIDTPGKGGRYALDLTKRDLNALIKRFAAWQIAQEEAKAARAAALAAPKAETPETDTTDNDEEWAEALEGLNDPTDEEIAEIDA